MSEEEYALLKRAAEAGSKTLGEWCRHVILSSANGRSPEGQKSGEAAAKALMAELVALRTILLNVLYKQANGEKLTAEEMKRLIERADADKIKKAVERLYQVANSDST